MIASRRLAIGRSSPMAPASRRASGSTSVTAMPRLASRSAQRVPASPAPTTIACSGGRWGALSPGKDAGKQRAPAVVAFRDLEADALEAGANTGGHGSRRENCAGRGQPGEFAQHLGRPDIVVSVRLRVIEDERIDSSVEGGKAGEQLAEDQRERNPARVHLHAVETGNGRRPDRGEPHGQRMQFGEARQDGREIGASIRVLLEGDVVEPRARVRVAAQRIPCGEEVQPGAEAGLEDREGRPPLPARGQRVGPERHAARLVECFPRGRQRPPFRTPRRRRDRDIQRHAPMIAPRAKKSPARAGEERP